MRPFQHQLGSRRLKPFTTPSVHAFVSLPRDPATLRSSHHGARVELSALFNRFWRELLPAGGRVRFGIVLGVALVAAVFEMLGVASIAPFMAAVLDDSLISRTPLLASLLDMVGATTPRDRLVSMGAITLVAIVAGNVSAGVSFYVQQRFSARCRARWSGDLFERYMRSPYSFHVKRDAPSLQKILLSDVDTAANALVQALVLVSRVFVITALLLLIVIKSPAVALGAAAAFGGGYGLIYKLVQRKQNAMGLAVSVAQTSRVRAAQEGLGGVKELIVLQRLQEVVSSYRASVSMVASGQAANQVAGSLPRYVLESVAYGGLVLVTLVLISGGGGAEAAIPTLTLLAFAAYRLMPALQQVFYAIVTLRFSAPSIESLLNDWREVEGSAQGSEAGPVREQDRLTTGASGVLNTPPFIEVRDASLTYVGAVRPSLASISLTIAPGQSVGLVGRTGAGKTTLADLLLGLYTPDHGSLLVDGQELNSMSMRAFRARVGYVPQQVFLSNATVAENIAFGLPAALIDRAAVEEAARLAQADEFVRELPSAYDTIVGERGVKLSGGQRQRLGIARALYHRPSLLVFDEATSALDGLTEDSVMEAIRRLAGERTVILVAHRLRTVEACDRIVLLDAGRVVAQGTYAELEETSAAFRRLTGHGSEAHRKRATA